MNPPPTVTIKRYMLPGCAPVHDPLEDVEVPADLVLSSLDATTFADVSRGVRVFVDYTADGRTVRRECPSERDWDHPLGEGDMKPMTFDTHPDWQALLTTIRTYPDADLPRLVAADWLTEQGHEGYAEFIRIQCDQLYREPCGQIAYPLEMGRQEILSREHLPEWGVPGAVNLLPHWAEPRHYTGDVCVVWSRGFVGEVRAPLAWLIGGECENCGGTGLVDTDRYEQAAPCPDCGGCFEPTCDESDRGYSHGTGRTPGHLDELVKCQPVTRVVVTDWQPQEAEAGWYYVLPNSPHGLSPAIVEAIRRGRFPRFHNDPADALDALSLALLNPARERAGLPPLAKEHK